MQRVRVHLLISGVVQGVGFRAALRREARRRGVVGWVRNLPDGRVEAVLEGGAAQVQEVLAWCRHGPPGARVTDVATRHETPRGDAEDFRIVG